MVPQSIAYASLAGLTPEVGLNSAFAGGFLYVIFGTIKQVSIGPTSLMSLLTFEYTKNVPSEFLYQYIVLLTFMCGCVELIMGVLRLGFLVDVISAPVISGFTSASALIIIISQIKEILGIRLKSESLRDYIVQLVQNIHKARLTDATLGISCIVILLLLRKLKDVSINENTSLKRFFKKCLWFVSTGRNALIVLTCCLITYHLENNLHSSPFRLTTIFSFAFVIGLVLKFKLSAEAVKPGLPELKAPSFELQQGNTTITFTEMVHHLGSGFVVIPIIAVLINVSIAKAFATGGKIDATQEMLTLSMCNIAASFLNCMPICGAFTRSAVSNASGVRTPFSNFYSAIITILALTFLTPYFHYIPRATLAAVLMAAVVFLIDFQILLPLWRSCKRDFLITITTLLASLYYGVEIGLLIGVLANLSHLIYLWARPSVAVDRCKTDHGEYILVTPDLGLFYPAIDHLNNILSKTVAKNPKRLPIAVNCCYFKGVDYSALKGLAMTVSDFNKRGQRIIFFNATDDILKIYRKSRCGSIQFIAVNENLNDILFEDEDCMDMPVLEEAQKGNYTAIPVFPNSNNTIVSVENQKC